MTPLDSDIFRPLSLKVPAVVAHAVCFTFFSVAESACCENPYGFAQQADKATLSDVKQTAWATTAGTFKLSGLKMSLSTGVKECY